MGELLRKAAHIGVGACALLVARIPPAAGVALAALALVHNAFLLPRYARILWRDEDHRRGFSVGVIAYSVTLLVLSVVAYGRPEIVAGAWGILAWGDGFSTLVGRSIGGPKIPWNPSKSWAGSIAFVVGGGLACAALSWDASRLSEPNAPLDPARIAAASIAAAAVGAVVESLPLALDDNLTAPLASAAVLWVAGAFDAGSWSASRPEILERAAPAIAGSLVLGGLALWAGATGAGGFVAGVLLLTILGMFGGWGLFAAAVTFVVLGSLATRWGVARKAALGLAEPNRGRRSARQAFSKLAVPAGLAVLACASLSPQVLLLAATAALAAACADTCASEIGPLFSSRALVLPSFRVVPAGTRGGISVPGTLAAAGGALPVAFSAFAGGALSSPFDATVAVLAALTAMFAESIAGAALIPRGLVGSGTLNLAMTAAAAWNTSWVQGLAAAFSGSRG